MISWTSTTTEMIDGQDTETVAVADVKARAYGLTPATLNPYMHDTETTPVEGQESYWWNEFSRPDDDNPDMYTIANTSWGDYVGIMANRCNWLYLTEHHDTEVVRLGRSEHDGQSLAIPATGRISVELADAILCLDEHAMIDDEMYDEVLQEVIQECWDSYGAWDLRREVETFLATDDLDWVDWYRVWQEACADTDYYPEPEGATNVMLWNDDVVAKAVDNVQDQL